MDQIRRSIFFSAAERYASVLVSIVSTAILARLLTPQEFGVYAVVSALTMVVGAALQEFGGANYLIQKPNLSMENIRTAFTITFCMSAGLAAVIFELRDVVVTVFAKEELRNGIAVLSLSMLLTPFAISVSALLRRDMAFGPLSRSTFLGSTAGALASVILAALGWSYMAPVWGAVLGNLALVTALLASRPGWEIFRPCLRGGLDVFRFGAVSSTVVTLNLFYQAFPQFIIGRLLGFDAVGLYGRSVSVTQLFDRLVLQVLNPVIMPAIFANSRAGGDLKRIYLNSIELITAVQWPFLLFLAIMVEPIIGVWLGSTWMEVVPLIRYLCLGSLSLSAACLTYPILVAVGRVQDTLTASFISLTPSLLIISAASSVSVEAVAASALLTMPLQAAVSLWFIARRLGIGPTELVRSTGRSSMLAGMSAAGPLVVQMVWGTHGAQAGPAKLVILLVAGTLATMGWCLGLWLTRHPLLAQIRLASQGLIDAIARRWRQARPKNYGGPPVARESSSI